MTEFDGAADLSTATSHLERTRPWVRFLSIVGFVSAAFLVCVGLLGGAGMAMNRNPAGVVIFIFYPILGALYVVPSLYLSRYANHIGQFVQSRQQADLVSALDAQRAFWKFVGIMAIVSIVFTIIAIPLAIIFGVLAAMAGAR